MGNSLWIFPLSNVSRSKNILNSLPPGWITCEYMVRVLLDEDVPIRLRHFFPEEVRVETVEYRGWKGLEKGVLLRAAQGHFDVLVTLENSVSYQQPLQQFDLALVVLRPSLQRLENL